MNWILFGQTALLFIGVGLFFWGSENSLRTAYTGIALELMAVSWMVFT